MPALLADVSGTSTGHLPDSFKRPRRHRAPHAGEPARGAAIVALLRAMHRLIARALGGALVIGVAVAAPAVAFDPAVEAQNFAKTEERQLHVTSTPEFQQLLIERNTQAPLEAAEILADDPERNFAGNVCFQRGQECAGELRFYDWEEEGYGLKRPVLFTARSGATISGTVWATRRGPAEAARDRDHDRLGPGAGDAVLGRRRQPRQARLRGPHLRRAGPGAVGHLRRGAGRPGGRALTGRTAVRRRHRGRARLPALRPRAPVQPPPAAAATPTRAPRRTTRPSRSAGSKTGSTPASTRYTALVDASRVGIAGHSLGAARGLVRRAEGPARRRDRGLRQPLRAGPRVPRARGRLPGSARNAATAPRSPSPRWGSRTTTGSRPRRTRPTPTRRPPTPASTPIATPAWTRCRSTSAAAATRSRRSSRAARSRCRSAAPRCAATTWSSGTRRPGSTST